MAEAASERAERFAWPNVTREVVDVYEEALSVPQPEGRMARLAQRTGQAPEPGPRVPPQRLPRSSPRTRPPAADAWRAARRVVVVAGAVLGIGLALLALRRLGIESLGRAIVAATPVWVLVAFALMCASMLLRAEAWNAILRAALPGIRVRRRDTARGTMIGVLMSATLPARLGEPSRALIVARRVGRVRDRFPIVLGTLVSQTILNILALISGRRDVQDRGAVPGERGCARGGHDRPRGDPDACALAPWLLRRGKPTRFQRVQQAAALARGAMVQVRRAFRSSASRSWAAGPPPCSSPHGASGGSPVACCSAWRSGSTTRLESAPRLPCCSP